MSEVESTNKKYRGNCHCGAFIFEVEVPEIKEVTECQCSICMKKGYLWIMPKKPMTVLKGEGTLIRYSFGPKNLDHHFCPTCGIAPLGTTRAYPEDQTMEINVRTIQGLDLWSLEVKPMDGAKLDPQYVVPAYSGPEPSPPGFDEGKVYHGSCHCGAVTAAVKVKDPLEDGLYKEPIVDCNCSICRRGGFVWIYPTKDQLAIQGSENLTYYAFGNKVWRRAFCKTCGVYVFTDLNPLTDEEVAALPEFVQKFRASKINHRPFNLRVLNGYDLKNVKPMQLDGWNNIQPLYVNP